MKNFLMLLAIIGIMLLLGIFFSDMLDKGIKSQDTMLCNSAKKSGNADYLAKCACFYEGQDISCVQK